MKFTRFELEGLIEEIKEIINYMEMSRYEKRRQRLYLSNGDKLNFSVPNESIAHLLGVNTNYLMSTGRFNTTNSFELLKEMCDNPYRLYKLYSEGNINLDKLFSPFIVKKIANFKENIKITIEETVVVCKYDSSKTYYNEQISQKYDYIIVKKYNDGKIGILCLAINNSNYGSYCVPMSNQIYDSFEDASETLNKYLKNQEISLLTGIHLFNIESDYEQKFSLPLIQKTDKVSELETYANLFNCNINLTGEYKYMLNKTIKNRDDYLDDSDLIDLIVTSIRKGKLIDPEIFKNSNLSKVIETFNDFLCKKYEADESSIGKTYTSLSKDLEVLKKELLKAQEKIQNLTQENQELNKKNETLNEENEQFKIREDEIIKILKPRM